MVTDRMWENTYYYSKKAYPSHEIQHRSHFTYGHHPLPTVYEHNNEVNSPNIITSQQTLDNEQSFEGFSHLECKYFKA